MDIVFSIRLKELGMMIMWPVRAAIVSGAGVILGLFGVFAQSSELPSRSQGPAPVPSFEASVIHKEKGKCYSCVVRLTFRNPTDRAVWYVLPGVFANELFPYDGIFPVDEATNYPLEVREHGEKKSRAVIVEYGATSTTFDAVCVPPNGVLKWDGCLLYANQPVRFMDLWVVNEILVDGKTPIAQWLGINLTSAEDADVGRLPRDWHLIDRTEMTAERHFRFLKCDPVKRYVVPLPDSDNQIVEPRSQ